MSTRAERTAVIEELENKFKDAQGIYLTDNNGINVEKVTKLRAEMRAKGIHFEVVKNTLTREALTRSGIDGLSAYLMGPTAIAVTQDDGTSPARIIRDFQKENKNLLPVKAAFVDGTVFESKDAAMLADIPSREELLAQLLGVLQAPVGKFAGVLNGIFTKFVGTLEAVKEKKNAAQ